MEHSRLQVFDPPMCCSSGVCGPNVDPDLLRFARDVAWLQHKQGVEVERYNLSSHPAACAREECVREALSKEGSQCLPLVLADGVIVSRGVYPSRRELMSFAGIGEAAKAPRPEGEATPTYGSSSEAAFCGPGCDCGPAPGRKGIKIAVSLIALLVVVGALIHKGASAGQTASSNTATADASAFAVAQAAPASAPATAEQPAGGMDEGKGVESMATQGQPDAKGATEAQPAKAEGRIGEYLKSLSDLNTLAMSQDAVFIFVPGSKNESVDDGAISAVHAAQEALEKKNVALGLYTLRTDSSDYPALSKQVPGPAIVVASKGRGMSAVSGDVTKAKLLQAYVASSSAASCGPSGCGPSGCN